MNKIFGIVIRIVVIFIILYFIGNYLQDDYIR